MKSLGLFTKYSVSRTDGKDSKGNKHHGCNYFVLDLTHDHHAVAALEAYAHSCERDKPQLARELRGWIDQQDWAQVLFNG